MEPLLIHARHGDLWAYPTDKYLGESIIKFGEYSELEFQFLKDCLERSSFSGTDFSVVEVGANAGYLTIPIANIFRDLHVHAYEPQESVRQLLLRNCIANSLTVEGDDGTLSRVMSYPFACGSVTDTIDCPVVPYSTPGNHGGIPMGKEAHNGKVKEFVKVPLVKLDNQGHESVKLIKADVEGMELQVLKGGRQLILRDLPILYVENDRADRSQELIEYVWGLGYWCAWHTPPLFNPDNFFRKPARENPWGAAQSINMVCVPKDRRLPAGVPTRHRLRLIDDATKHPTKDEV